VSLAVFEIASIVVLLSQEDVAKFVAGYYLISILVSLAFMLIIELVFSIANKPVRYVLAGVLAFFFALLLVGNIFLHKFFGQFLTEHMLNFVFSDPTYLSNYGRTYLWGVGGVAFLGFVVLFYMIWRPRHARVENISKQRWIISFVSLLVAFMVLGNQTYKHSKEDILSMDGASATAFRSFLVFKASGHELAAAKHDAVPQVAHSHYNILLVVNESWGKKGLPFYGSRDNAMPFLTHWMASDTASFFRFEHAFTNSSATDVSMPSLLTGVAPYESFRKLHREPFLWDYAKAAGLRTGYVSAQRYGWANLNEFLFSPGPDFVRTAEKIDAPIISDCGVDDLLAVRVLDKFIANATQHFFAIYNSNALHTPFQQTSTCLANQPSFKSRYENAEFILDKTFAEIYSALKASGALDSTIIVFTADHGESDALEHMPRINSYYDEVANIPFLVYLPASWRAEHPQEVATLQENTTRNVMNLDIAPTIAELAGVTAKDILGTSLLRSVDPNRVCIALNTNEIRSWDHDGFGIYSGDMRFVYTDIEGARFFHASNDPREMRNDWSRVLPNERQFVLQTISANALLAGIYKP
jgi:glucan phosphoethanolaminetransferase (alkaline phosphatase superfamily)